ncbi:hypothetical protein VTK73DRAFT_2921 [Phialemonium thermophilum]|uniref:SMP-LTD domain-containing protein n=1 Tax=Phialemonium thermophilum TaxID=223376 RepID=A0ABR3X2F0_9PEZI
MGWTTFLTIYLLGGITFLPLILIAVLLHAYFTFPYRRDVGGSNCAEDDVVQPGDDVTALKAAQKADAKLRTPHPEYDVAAGYFAVCREYAPMGINAKPIERATPVGSATVAAPSPSVYQAMYRSIFDRKQTAGPLDNSNASVSQRPKKAGNVFYVVLRHGHLMLFDDDEQLEVRHVISLAHHDVSIYSGETRTPEGELFIKKNAICLTRRTDGQELGPDTQLSKPFYLFSENCSAKEDFYFALLRNQEQTLGAEDRVPSPLAFDVEHIISLVQKLHYSEEHLQTRWLNALIGRIFLGIYKTKDIENFIREKLTKKISRVKRPSFLSNIEIKSINTGDSAPFFTNLRLKDLTVAGECGVEADLRYTGNFRLEVAATARIDLGARFKAREVNLVLAVVLRKLEGHVLFKIKPPPSNRIWFSFQQMPKMEMTIEPIVSSRQITYTVILRQIENRIKEVVAETLVLPFWDDTPFFKTEHKRWRGGIFAGDDAVESVFDPESTLAQMGDVDDVERLDRLEESATTDPGLPIGERSHSAPIIEPVSTEQTASGKKAASKSSGVPLSTATASGSATNLSEARDDTPPTLRPGRSSSLVNPPTPTVSTDSTHADLFKPSSSPPNQSPAAMAFANLSFKSQSNASSQPSTVGLVRPYTTSKSSNQSSGSSLKSVDMDKEPAGDSTKAVARRNTTSSTSSYDEHSISRASTTSTEGSLRTSKGSLARGLFTRRDNSATSSAPPSPGLAEPPRRTALAAVTNAAASAKRWGLNALNRQHDGAGNGLTPDSAESPLDLNQPMGRGRPLPPPGTPLPMPERKTKTAPIPVPARKPVPPPLPERQNHSGHTIERRPVPPPPLPKRRQVGFTEEQPVGDGVFVVEAPLDSEPTTPKSATDSTYQPPWVEDAEDEVQPPTLPRDEGGSHQLQRSSLQEEFGDESKSTPNPDEQQPAESDDDFSAWMEDAGPADARDNPTTVNDVAV